MHRNNKYIDPEIRAVQKSLPVFKYKQQIMQTVINHPITLIIGQTGSGKTTQIPQYLLEWNQVSTQQKIVCTQPRIVAAQSVAQRVAEEQGERTGGTVGYHIRLDKCIGNNTKLEYMTEGVLLRKAMSCDNLSEYKVVIIDEAHERTVNADLLMGFLKKMVTQRNDLRVIIMSATLDKERFLKYFNDPPVIDVPGSTNPVQHHWLKEPTKNYIEDTIELIKAIHVSDQCVEYDPQQRGSYKPDGHILVFLTGQQEIDEVVQTLNKEHIVNRYNHTLEVYPLYSALPPDDRSKAFSKPDNPSTARKCVVATNIAETSLTIKDVVYVIDSGLSKQKVYSPMKGIEILGIQGISKASVKQRCGRAGRVKPGVAYHLYTQLGYQDFVNETPAEILRSGLVNEILSMLALGMSNPLKFDFIDPPDEMTMARALHILKNLNAIDMNCKITSIGRQMAKFPVNPRMAKSLVIAKEYGCVYEMVVIAAMMEVVDRLWRKPRGQKNEHRRGQFKNKKKGWYHTSGDHLTLLNIYNGYETVKNNRSNVKGFCDDNFLHKKSLDRADKIRRQIENTLIRVMQENDDQKYNDNNNNNHNNNNYYQYQPQQQVKFNATMFYDAKYYENILMALLSGHFMNIAVKGFGDNFWRFRLLDMDCYGQDKAVDIIDKAKCHQDSMFHKNNSNRTNWVIFHDVSCQHTIQLKVLTAINPEWLLKINSNSYYNIQSLRGDKTPISHVLKDIAAKKGMIFN